MPAPETLRHLASLYAASDDPWNMRTSAYERAKYQATLAHLPRRHYRRALEIGCGIGELSALLVTRCDQVTGIDCIADAVNAAHAAHASPRLNFALATVPQDLPTGHFDLVVLSEVLYFLTAEDIRILARRLLCPTDIVLVNWRGSTGTALSGTAAEAHFLSSMPAPASCSGHVYDDYAVTVVRSRIRYGS